MGLEYGSDKNRFFVSNNCFFRYIWQEEVAFMVWITLFFDGIYRIDITIFVLRKIIHFSHGMNWKKNVIYKGRAFPLVGVTVRHLQPSGADAVMMITEESHYFNGGSMSIEIASMERLTIAERMASGRDQYIAKCRAENIKMG